MATDPRCSGVRSQGVPLWAPGVPHAQRRATGELCSPAGPTCDEQAGTTNHAGAKPGGKSPRAQRGNAGKGIVLEGKPGEGKLGLPGPTVDQGAGGPPVLRAGWPGRTRNTPSVPGNVADAQLGPAATYSGLEL